jgi:hypothetical protein
MTPQGRACEARDLLRNALSAGAGISKIDDPFVLIMLELAIADYMAGSMFKRAKTE